MTQARTVGTVGLITALLALAGCRQDMQDQPKFFPQRGTTFYPDGRSARPQVANTVARNQMHEDVYFYTGMQNGKEGDGLPIPLSTATIERGQERYNVYCTPCHSRVGNGMGMIVQRGYALAGNFHTGRLRSAPLGHFFSVMTNGYGTMPDYAAQLTAEDRWAVAAYIRALQLSQNAKAGDAPAGTQARPLTEIAQTEGMPVGFAGAWALPATSGVVVPTVEAPVTAAASSPQTPVAGAASSTPATPAPPVPGANPASPATPAAPPKPKAPSAEDIAAGHEIFTKNCQVCHQATLAGLPPNIPALVGVVSRIGPAQVRQRILGGSPTAMPPMPAFANRLSTDDIDHVIAFLGSTSGTAAPKAPAAKPPPAAAPEAPQ